MEKIAWTDHVRNEGVLQRVYEDRSTLTTTIGRKSNWTAHILLRNCFIKHFVEGKLERMIDVTGRQGRRSKQLLDDFKETRRHWKF